MDPQPLASPTPRPSPNAYWVTPGGFWAGDYPLRWLNEQTPSARLQAMLASGLDTFIDLTEEGERVPYGPLLLSLAQAQGRAVQHLRRPIRDVNVPQTAAAMVYILDALDGALAAGRRVYLHCWGGVGRTGTVVGCHLVRHGLTGDAAVQQLADWWPTLSAPHLALHPRSPETAEQVAYIRRWREP